jgi:hypothetical protein
MAAAGRAGGGQVKTGFGRGLQISALLLLPKRNVKLAWRSTMFTFIAAAAVVLVTIATAPDNQKVAGGAESRPIPPATPSPE